MYIQYSLVPCQLLDLRPVLVATSCLQVGCRFLCMDEQSAAYALAGVVMSRYRQWSTSPRPSMVLSDGIWPTGWILCSRQRNCIRSHYRSGCQLIRCDPMYTRIFVRLVVPKSGSLGLCSKRESDSCNEKSNKKQKHYFL